MILFLPFLFLTLFASAQKNDHLVSFDGIGALKLRMDQGEVEKLLNKKIVFKHIGVDQALMETIQAKYLGADIELTMFGSDTKSTSIEDITTTNPQFKTADGIGIGTDQSTILNKYGDAYLLIIQPVWEAPDYNKRSKNQMTITVAEIENYRTAIIFSLANNKVVSITVGPTPEFRDRE